MRRNRSWARAIGLICCLSLLGGCQLATQKQRLATEEQRLLAESGERAHDPEFHASDEALQQGKVHFRNGDWGLAEENFRQAVELAPRDAEAWIGLAATYDRLRRFELADRAYANAVKLVGHNVVVLNNLGYSNLLRGNIQEARRNFLLAHEKDPSNPYTMNNLELLDESGKSIKRPT